RQRARFARRPELLEIADPGRLAVEPGRRRESLLVTIPASRHRQGPLPAASSPVPTEDDELVAGEQVGQALRLQIIQVDAVGREREVGEHRRRYLGGE